MHQRQPRCAAGMRDGADRGPHQDRAVDRARQHPRASRHQGAGSTGATAARASFAGRREGPGRRWQGDRPADPDLRKPRLLRWLPDHAGAARRAPIGKAAQSLVPEPRQGKHHHPDPADRFRRGLRQDQVCRHSGAFSTPALTASPFRPRRRHRRRASGRRASRPSPAAACR